MHGRAAAIAVFALFILPLALADARQGGGNQGLPAPTYVTLLDPLVEIPGTVVGLDFMTVVNGKLKHGASADGDPMKFASGQAHSLGVHLQFRGSDLRADLSTLIAFSKSAGQSGAAPAMTLVWGRLGAFDVLLGPLDSSAVEITDGGNGKGQVADVSFVVAAAAPPSVPRSVAFGDPALGLAAWMLSFSIDKSVPWEKHRNSQADRPELEFTSGQGRSMSCELMFDMYEDGGDVAPSLLLLAARGFDSTSPNATAPVDLDWGPSLHLRGFLVDSSFLETVFLPDGKAARAHLWLNLTGLFQRSAGGEPPAEEFAGPRPATVHFGEPALPVGALMLAFDAWRNNSDNRVSWQDHRNADSPTPEFKAPTAMNLSVELLFDTYEERASVTTAIGGLLDLAAKLNDTTRPPRVAFTWGAQRPAFEGVLEAISVKYTMFLPDGTPVRATAGLHVREAEQVGAGHGNESNGTAAPTRADAMATDHHGTTTSAEGYATHSPANAEWADITLLGPMTGEREPMLDWFLSMANGRASALEVKIRFWLPEPSAGAWECTQARYTPTQFGPGGPADDKITVRAEVRGLKEGEAPQFAAELEMHACVIDATGQRSDRHTRPDEFVKATGFTVAINGSRSQADTFEGGEVSVALRPVQNGSGHYGPGRPTFGNIVFTRGAGGGPDWGNWYDLSKDTAAGLALNVVVNCTASGGNVVLGWEFLRGVPVNWEPPDLDADQSGMAIEMINISVEKVERA